jgi:UDP-N-acetylmuramoyl-tripeptide--D-alanyl-D-alanine ligase
MLNLNTIEIFLLLSLLVHLIYTTWKLKKDLHILQLNSYKNSKYFKWMRKNLKEVLKIRNFLPFLACIPLFWKFNLFGNILWIMVYLGLFLTRPRAIAKKPLIFTARAKRLYGTNLVLLCACYTLLGYKVSYSSSAVILIGLNICTPLLMILSNSLILPIEKLIARWYYRDAQKRLKQFDSLLKIGITGSYGKTSTKHFLNNLLAQKFNTLMTPKSYNSTMGVTKTIRSSLKPVHEIFIAEMGATQKGDIKELCTLVSPKIGVLTAIGPQHLETFKTLENVKKTKYELIESLPPDGIAFLNIDDPNIRMFADQVPVKTIYYGLESNDAHYLAQNIECSACGSFFTVRKHDGTQADFYTKLLGKHNILNILAAVSVACELGLDLQTLTHFVKNLEPVTHRLEIKKNARNITIIDDAFNSNLKGAKMALDVLKDLSKNKKILITPGMIELGSMEYELNHEFGCYAADTCDFIILVGLKQTIPIQHALKIKNYPKGHLYIAKNLNEALQYLQKISAPGDTVLLENDLTDDYERP